MNDVRENLARTIEAEIRIQQRILDRLKEQEEILVKCAFAELEDNLASRAAVYREIRRLVDSEVGPDDPERVYVAGRPVLEVTFGEYMAEDMQTMIPLVIVVIVLVLFLTFRTLAGVLLPLLVAA